MFLWQAIAIRFAEEGAKVVVFSRGGCDETIKLISQIEGLGNVDDVALSCKCDISDEDAIAAMVKATTDKFGEAIHVLVNNAAFFVFHSVEHATAADWDKSCSVNIKGHALVTKGCLPAMKKAGGGSIVFQGSISSFLGQPDCATYSTVKGAIVQMVRGSAAPPATQPSPHTRPRTRAPVGKWGRSDGGVLGGVLVLWRGGTCAAGDGRHCGKASRRPPIASRRPAAGGRRHVCLFAATSPPLILVAAVCVCVCVCRFVVVVVVVVVVVTAHPHTPTVSTPLSLSGAQLVRTLSARPPAAPHTRCMFCLLRAVCSFAVLPARPRAAAARGRLVALVRRPRD